MRPEKTDTTRYYGLDLLRVLSMAFVICLHILNHGGMAEKLEMSFWGGQMSLLLRICVYPAVDCFVLLSGYLLSTRRFRLERVAKQWSQVAFWSVAIQCAFYLMDLEPVTLGKTVFMFLPVSAGRYWFYNAYLVMVLFSPFLNRLIGNLDRGMYNLLLGVLFLVFCAARFVALGNDVFGTQNGYGFSWFMALYLVGGYLQRFCNGMYSCRRLCGTIGLLNGVTFACIMLSDLVALMLPAASNVGQLLLSYTSPLVVGSAVCMVLLFADMKAESGFTKLAGRIGPHVFAVYLIHDHPMVREKLIAGQFEHLGELHPVAAFGAIVGWTMIIFGLCVLLDWLRAKLIALCGVDQMIRNLCRSAERRIRKLLKERESNGH